MNQTHFIVDVDLDLGIRSRQDFIDLCRIGLCRIQREYLHCIPLRPLHPLKRFHAASIPFLAALAHDHCNLLLPRQAAFLHRPDRLRRMLQQTAKLFCLHDLVCRRDVPFLLEQGTVAPEQRIGTPGFFRHLLVAISFQEACMSEMMNKCVMTEEEIPSLLQNAQGIIIILEVAGTELLVKKPHLVEHFPLEEKAKSYERRLLLPRCRVRFVVVHGKCLHFLHALVRNLNLLIIGAAHSADHRITVKRTTQIRQPILRDDGVAIEEQELRSFRNFQALIAAPGEALILLVVDASKIPLLFEPLCRAVL